MAQKKGGLGRGFDSLFDDNTADSLSDKNRVVNMPVGDIEPDENQPRKTFDDEPLGELADSIREHGILQPLIVRPQIDGSYKIVAGERRYRAARLVGLSEVPVIVRAFSDEEVAVIALIENLQREDLNPIEQAEGIQKLIEQYSFTQEQAAQKLGMSRSAVTNTLRLMNLPEKVRDQVRDDYLSAGHARAILSLDTPQEQETAADEVIGKHLSVRQTERMVKTMAETGKKPPRQKKERDKFYDETELSLGELLGRKVKIKNAKKGGTLEIEYFDDEDLKYLAKSLE